ncbi:MAG: riboflavin synthase [Candidatus Peribacteraceae bacterium]|nr:riboflavin synthase [Candidatus Peribacteraceae bacterium]
MFTGVIEATGIVKEKTEGGLRISRPDAFTDIRIGSSICVSGACLSVIACDAQSMTFDVVPETWERTKLGSLQAGDVVNLERALSAQGRFEGHIVQGHVEGVATVQEFRAGVLTITLPDTLVEYVFLKGSVAIDGVSLTVADIRGNACAVALIPHTIRETTLGELKEGDLVNVETDILVRAVRERLSPPAA